MSKMNKANSSPQYKHTERYENLRKELARDDKESKKKNEMRLLKRDKESIASPA